MAFDWQVYCTANRDLWQANIRTRRDALTHWKKYGINEPDRITSIPPTHGSMHRAISQVRVIDLAR